jgi:5-methylcytosine-specific restriction endonuclease McrA
VPVSAHRPHRERISKATRAFVLRRDNYTCHLCHQRKPAFYLTCDHKVPSSHGGTGLVSNLATCCKICNTKRGAKKLDQL